MTRSKHSAGFTLVEMIMVIVIVGVIAAMVAVFIKAPVEGYFSTVRRAALTEEADSALRFVARDLQSALPNSIACTSTSTSSGLQFLTVRSGGRYREAPSSAGTETPLVFGTATSSFDMIGGSADSVTKDARGNNVSGSASKVVVGNLSSGVPTCHSDYSNITIANNAATLTSIGGSVMIGSNTYPPECYMASPTVQNVSFTSHEINDREFGRFYVVDSSPVSYSCDTTNGLTRTSGSSGTTALLVARSHVASACQVDCVQTKARVQLITFNLTLKDRDNEPVTMLRRVTIVNRP